MKRAGLVLYFVCVISGVLSKSAEKVFEEGSFATLPCLSTDENQDYWERIWYNGSFDDTKPGGTADKIFEQDFNGNIVVDNGSPHLSINKDNFTLVISSVELGDNGDYSSYVFSQKSGKVWDNIDLQVYIQPADSDLQIGEVDGPLIEGIVVTVSCTVDRLYPEINITGSFSITWGEETNSSFTKHDPVGTDKAFKYTVTITKTLNSSDNGTTIQCDLKPEIGTAVHQRKTVIVNSEQAPDSGLSGGEIAGIVIGSLAGVALIGGIIYGICVWCGCIVHLGCCKCKKGTGTTEYQVPPVTEEL